MLIQQPNGEELRLSECPMCGGYGIRDNGKTCKTCGGCGELFNGLKYADYQKTKERAKQ